MISLKKMIRLYTAANLQEAFIIKNLLELEGINCSVRNFNSSSIVGEIPFTHAWPEVWLIQEKDRQKGEKVLNKFKKERTDENKMCENCSEINPLNFEFCWNCYAAL